ncbi:hypothetical protein AGOR_G00130490 [Albula goreensis]|uniref:Beta-1,4-galactosyltransferase n=1 Tax=Albula goreensis TaxID=1534307 RepID=A0A8T3DBD5_9TELE|nr:hypothetical protein AGOR_G00130490 [Albula goreensis]
MQRPPVVFIPDILSLFHLALTRSEPDPTRLQPTAIKPPAMCRMCVVAMQFWRGLDSPCTLSLLVVFQLAFVLYFSLGGFHGLASFLALSTQQEFDYSRAHDVYTNLSRLEELSSLHPGRQRTNQLKYCPRRSPLLVGPVSVRLASPRSMDEIWKRNPVVSPGSLSTSRLLSHLRSLLYHLHPFLQRQQLHYRIYVVHQEGRSTFNRAKLLNVGVREALKDEEWDCLFLHDVDLLPENDHNTYTCNSQYPTHMSVAMDKFRYKLPYSQYFGGVSALTPDQYLRMNGFPNRYWGWGGEDDDIAARVHLSGMKIIRPSVAVGHYKMIKHKVDKGNEVNPKRFNLLMKTRSSWRSDGLNTLTYTLLSKQLQRLYTNLSVNIGDDPVRKAPLPPAKPPAKNVDVASANAVRQAHHVSTNKTS